MSKKNFRCKTLIYASLILFSLFIVSNSYSSSLFQAAQDWEKELQAGIDLYNEGQFSEAIMHFNRVLSLTQDGSVLANVHYNLSICHFYAGDMDAAEESVKNLLELDPSRQAPDGFPAKYSKLYAKARKALSKEAARMTEAPPQRQETQDTQYRARTGESKNKKSKILLIAGGVALAAVVGTVGYFALSSSKGSIQCNSTPAGASVLLDGSSTGQVTPCTLDDVEPGSHTVTLALDGYVNYQQTINVEKRKTASITANLTAHTINISSPGDHAVWVKGNTYTITWNVGGTLSLQNIPLRTFSGQTFAFSPDLRRISPAFSNSASGRETLDRMAGQSRGPASIEQRNRASAPESRTGVAARSPNNGHDLMMRGAGISSMIQRRGGMLSGAQPPSSFDLNSQVRKPTALANVTIDLYRGGGKVMDIAPNTANNGSYSWQTPGDSVANAGDYKVRISASTDPSVYGESDNFWVSHTGSLNTTSNPAGAAIYWDGWETGQTTDSILTLPVGNQTIKLTRNLFRDTEGTTNILKDQTTSLHINMNPDSFTEDFSDGQAQYWTPLAGAANWDVRDGVYRFVGTQSSAVEEICYYKAGSAKFFGNFTYEADAERVSGAPYVVGISVGVESDHYRFILLDVEPPLKYFSIWYQRATGGQQGSLTPWTPFDKIHAFGLNKLKIVRIGMTLYFYINGYEVDVHTISYLEDWVEIGLWGYAGNPGDTVHFDNISMILNSSSPPSGITRTLPPPSEVTYRNDISPLYSPASKKK